MTRPREAEGRHCPAPKMHGKSHRKRRSKWSSCHRFFSPKMVPKFIPKCEAVYLDGKNHCNWLVVMNKSVRSSVTNLLYLGFLDGGFRPAMINRAEGQPQIYIDWPTSVNFGWLWGEKALLHKTTWERIWLLIDERCTDNLANLVNGSMIENSGQQGKGFLPFTIQKWGSFIDNYI